MGRRFLSALICFVSAIAGLILSGGTAASASVDTAHITNAAAFHGAVHTAVHAVQSGAACAVNVNDFRSAAKPTDDTPAFQQAIAAAVANHPTCYPAGPSGAPQAVVYVPAGTYRVASLYFPSNLRMEVDAGATLQLPPNRFDYAPDADSSMITWDSGARTTVPVQNVTLIGVGSAGSAGKTAIAAAGGAALAPFDIASDFTMNLDARATDSANYNTGVNMMNVQYFLIENVLSIQNGENQITGTTVAWPTSARAVIRMHARPNSPVGTGSYLQPKRGVVRDQVNVNSPRGYGPNQVNGANDVTFENIYSNGGTALRLETDGSTNGQGLPKFGATVDHLIGRNIVGVNCNRAVSLSPHGQRNGTVDISGVWAYSCNQGVIASLDADMLPGYFGTFDNATVTDVHVVAGAQSQLDSTATLWVVGQSMTAIRIDVGLSWTPTIVLAGSQGTFTRDAKLASKSR